MKTYFVEKGSIVRKIWGRADNLLFIFAGAAAEFALNKAVDWLYFTGRLPADPLGRLFSTVTYSRLIIFSEEHEALRSIDKITAIHQGVESARGMQIPEWAYRDVLFLLIDYSIRSFELLDKRLTLIEKQEIFHVFRRVGVRMRLSRLPFDFNDYVWKREEHLKKDLQSGSLTIDLYRQYKKHLGYTRYVLLKQVQMLLVPAVVAKKLRFSNFRWLLPGLYMYKIIRFSKSAYYFKGQLLPAGYKAQIQDLDLSETEI
jgi:hypothetical protein